MDRNDEVNLLLQKCKSDLLASENRFYSIIKNITDAVIIVYDSGQICCANIAAADLLGYGLDNLIGDKFAFPIVIGMMTEVELKGIDETVRRLEMQATATVWEGKSAHLVIMRDIDAGRLRDEQIEYLTYYDAITGLPNRHLFMECLRFAVQEENSKNQLVAVLLINLVRFKIVNDTFGYKIGNDLLKGIGKRLLVCVGESGILSCLGGGEFAVVLHDVIEVQNVANMAAKMQEVINQPWEVDGHEVRIAACIGIAFYPDDGVDAEQILQNSHTAMYRGKDEGLHACQFYTPAMNKKALESLEIESGLRRALERDEFLIYYQPQVNIVDGSVIGVEALVRWLHPKLGLMFPDDFIPIAEQTGMIVRIGEMVLRKACLQNKAWQLAGLPPMRVAVNLSARQFEQHNLVETVARILAETGLEPQWLELEITETIVMQDVEFTRRILQELQEMGIHISLDDFGIGFCSLSYLKKFPVKTLKIDRSFVSGIATDFYDEAIVKTITSLAQNLNLRVIAEGVETTEQLEFLKKRDCLEVQGYLFSEPVPAGQIVQDYMIPKLLNCPKEKE